MNFYSKIVKKRGLFWSTGPAKADVACVLTWQADVARGTTSGCDVALWPRGRAADGPRVTDTCACS